MNSFIFIKTNKKKKHETLFMISTIFFTCPFLGIHPVTTNSPIGTPLPVLLHKVCICRIGRTPPQLFALS